MIDSGSNEARLGRAVDVASVAVLVAVGAAFAVYVRRHPFTVFDDAYAFVRYADHVLGGWGPAWNAGGPPSYGTTSLLHLGTVIVARAFFPSVQPGFLLVGVSVAAVPLALLVTARASVVAMGGRAAGRRDTLRAMALIAALLLVSPAFRSHTVTGMDTVLGLLANATLILATLTWVRHGGGRRLAVVVGTAWLAFLARPESLLVGALFPPLLMVLQGRRSSRWRECVAYLGALALVLAADTLWKTWLFGHPLPLPFYAKRHGFYDGYAGAARWNTMAHVFDFGRIVLPFLLLAVALMTKRGLRTAVAFGAPVALVVGYLFTVLQVMGAYGRYYVPYTPFVVIGALACVPVGWTVWPRASKVERRGWPVGRVVAGLVLAAVLVVPPVKPRIALAYQSLVAPTSGPPVSPSPYRTQAAHVTDPLPRLQWGRTIALMALLIERLPPGVWVAMSEYGFIGASAPHVAIADPLGLHDAQVARQGFSVDVLLDTAPVLIWMPHDDYGSINAAILAAPRFWQVYDFFPGAFDYGLAVRRDVWSDDAIAPLIRTVWARAYGDRPMEAYLAVSTAGG